MTDDPEQMETIAEPISAVRHGARPESNERFPPGALLGSRYRIISRLGKGGMGEVFRADDLILRQPVAFPEGQGADVRRRLGEFGGHGIVDVDGQGEMADERAEELLASAAGRSFDHRTQGA